MGGYQLAVHAPIALSAVPMPCWAPVSGRGCSLAKRAMWHVALVRSGGETVGRGGLGYGVWGPKGLGCGCGIGIHVCGRQGYR